MVNNNNNTIYIVPFPKVAKRSENDRKINSNGNVCNLPKTAQASGLDAHTISVDAFLCLIGCEYNNI